MQWRRNELESGGTDPARSAGNFSFRSCPSTFVALKVQLVVLVSAFMMVSTVWLVFCLLFFSLRCPRAQLFVKWGGGTCPRALWSRRHCMRVITNIIWPCFLQRCRRAVTHILSPNEETCACRFGEHHANLMMLAMMMMTSIPFYLPLFVALQHYGRLREGPQERRTHILLDTYSPLYFKIIGPWCIR